MYFAGIYCDDEGGACWAVIVEKVLRNARKEYHVTDIRCFSKESFLQDIKSIYEDPCFLRKKKVFSQDRRPPKNTFTPPVLIFAVKSGASEMVNVIRADGIPVEGFFFSHQPGWTREEQKVLRFGTNLFVHRDDLAKLDKVLISPSIVWVDNENPEVLKLQQEIKRYLETKNIHGSLSSLMLALWHCETIKQIKRYGG